MADVFIPQSVSDDPNSVAMMRLLVFAEDAKNPRDRRITAAELLIQRLEKEVARFLAGVERG